jgi:hypothetical protein
VIYFFCCLLAIVYGLGNVFKIEENVVARNYC